MQGGLFPAADFRGQASNGWFPTAKGKGSAGGLRRRCRILCEMVYKPGSVLTAIYLGASLPVRSSHLGDGRASLMSP